MPSWCLTQPLAELPAWTLAAPGAGVAHLIGLGWASPDPAAGTMTALSQALPALGATTAWILIAVLLAASTFRWDPRQ